MSVEMEYSLNVGCTYGVRLGIGSRYWLTVSIYDLKMDTHCTSLVEMRYKLDIGCRYVTLTGHEL